MPKVFANGINIHYLRIGSGPDLVMLHGLTGNLAMWHLSVVPLLRRHYRVTTVDLRGHGYTDMPPTGYSSGELATDLEGLLDALDIERPYLVGHSYGADVSLNFALRHPERVSKLVVLEATVPALIDLRLRDDWQGWRYWVEALEKFGVAVPDDKRADADYMIRMSLQVPKVYGPATGHARKPEPVLRLLDTTTVVTDYEVVDDLTCESFTRITTPTLLLYGQDSAYMESYNFLTDRLPNRRGHILPPTEYGGHFDVLEQPALVAEYIMKFCQDNQASPSMTPELGETA